MPDTVSPAVGGNDAEPSLQLLARARRGDRGALERLCAIYLPPLTRWARGRLPAWARDLVNTDDLVQEALLRTVQNLDRFEPRGDGALRAYLRQAVFNRIRDEIRRSRRAPLRASFDSGAPARRPSPEDEAGARELVDAYESALGRLREGDREAIVLRVEFELPYREIARALGKASEEAAQMAVRRALVRLAREMGRSA